VALSLSLHTSRAGLAREGKPACQHEQVSEPRRGPFGVDVMGVNRLRLVEAAAPLLSPEDRAAMDRVWDAATRDNPSLFDGPVVACTGVEPDGPRSLILSWARVTYRYYALRQVPGAVALPSLFVTVVQPTQDGGLLAGRASSATAVPGRWTLPGGSVEPPDGAGTLDIAALRRHAAREQVEETGVDTACEDLTLWLVTRGVNGNIGVHFRAPSRPRSQLRDRFAQLVSQERALGRVPELDQIAFIRTPAALAHLPGLHADHLEPIVTAWHAAGSPTAS
jgi:8-oxo-dGTP pyrophosphatase MutT (NUDIX family)